MIRRPPRSTLSSSSAASDVYKRQVPEAADLRKDEPHPMSDLAATSQLLEYAVVDRLLRRDKAIEVIHHDAIVRRHDVRCPSGPRRGRGESLRVTMWTARQPSMRSAKW